MNSCGHLGQGEQGMVVQVPSPESFHPYPMSGISRFQSHAWGAGGDVMTCWVVPMMLPQQLAPLAVPQVAWRPQQLAQTTLSQQPVEPTMVAHANLSGRRFRLVNAKLP